jgi:diguanylate cyclase (GGDEF)-like protein
LRKPDHLFRYGGDEFIALLYEIDAKKALEAAERLRSEIEHKSFFIQSKEYKITLSIGVARFPDHGQDKRAVLQMADDAMYNSKKSGRNRVFSAGTIDPTPTEETAILNKAS